MCGMQALRIALDLRSVPSRVHHVRAEPLPEGVPLLLRIAAGEPEAERRALELVDRPLAEIREAATFFIEQILLAPEASSYRVLGTTPEASAAELRRNMALLMRWLHPDVEGEGERSVFAGRVTSAWDDLKTPERRAAYDRRRASASPPARSAKSPKKLSAKRRRRSTKRVSNGGSGRWLVLRQDDPQPGLFVRLLSFLSGRRWH